MELLMIACLYLMAGTIIMMIIQPHLEPRFHTLFFSITGIVISPVCVCHGIILGIIDTFKSFRKGGTDDDQT